MTGHYFRPECSSRLGCCADFALDDGDVAVGQTAGGNIAYLYANPYSAFFTYSSNHLICSHSTCSMLSMAR